MVIDISILNLEILSITISYKIHFHSLNPLLSLYLISHLLSIYVRASNLNLRLSKFVNDKYQHAILFMFENIEKLKCIKRIKSSMIN